MHQRHTVKTSCNIQHCKCSSVIWNSTNPRSAAFLNTYAQQWALQQRSSSAGCTTISKLSSKKVTSHHTKQELPPKYQRRQLNDLVAAQPWLMLTRGLQVGVAAAKLSLLHRRYLQQERTSVLRSQAATTSHNDDRSSPSAAYTRSVQQLVSGLGPLWVKLGQTLSVRPDIIGSGLAIALAGLQDGAPPFSNAVAADIIREDLGAGPKKLFSWISSEPVASASLGQVYQATLASDGRKVAVKVQRPGVWPQLQLDLAVLLSLLTLVKAVASVFGRRQDITAWADTLGCGLAQELDYIQEAHNMELFAAAHSHLHFLTTPQVVWQLTTHRVLCTTWVDGKAPKQLLKQAQDSTAPPASQSQPSQDHHPYSPQQQLSRLVTLGIEASLSQLVVTGVLHADPHPGNLLWTDEGQLAYLDFGLLVMVPQKASLAMMSALIHWAIADWPALCEDFDNMGLLKPNTNKQQLAVELQKDFEQLYSSVASKPSTQTQAAKPVSNSVHPDLQQQVLEPSTLLAKAGAISFSDFSWVILSLAVRFRFDLPPWYTLVIRSLVTLEGLALVVDPQIRSSITTTAVKVVARQLLCDSRPEAQQLLQKILMHPQQQGSLNLPLLTDLMHIQQNSPHTYISGKQDVTGLSFQTRSKQRTMSSEQLLQQLASLLPFLNPTTVVNQLSSTDGATVREALAQYLLARMRSQQHIGMRLGRGYPQEVTTTQQDDQQGPDTVNADVLRFGQWKLSPALELLLWLRRARWRGLLLAWQLIATTLSLVLKGFLRHFHQVVINSRQRA